MDKIETTHAGTRRHHFVGMKGDLRVELHYVDLGERSPSLAALHPHCGREACLYVFKARDTKNGCLIPMCQMWAFTPREIGQTRDVDVIKTGNLVERNARMVAEKLYGFATKSDHHRVLDVLCDYIEDLKNHPPETGLDKTLDEFLASVEDDTEGGSFFFEVNGERIHLG